MSAEAVKAKLVKLLALARRGEGGEKVNAERLMHKLLAQHDLTLADLEQENAPRTVRWFAFRNVAEKRLLVQIASAVMNTRDVESYRTRKRTQRMGLELTELEHLEMLLRWGAYRAAWKVEQERLYIAFISRHSIFPERRSEEPGDSGLSMEDLAAIEMMMAGIAPVHLRKALGAGA